MYQYHNQPSQQFRPRVPYGLQQQNMGLRPPQPSYGAQQMSQQLQPQSYGVPQTGGQPYQGGQPLQMPPVSSPYSGMDQPPLSVPQTGQQPYQGGQPLQAPPVGSPYGNQQQLPIGMPNIRPGGSFTPPQQQFPWSDKPKPWLPEPGWQPAPPDPGGVGSAPRELQQEYYDYYMQYEPGGTGYGERQNFRTWYEQKYGRPYAPPTPPQLGGGPGGKPSPYPPMPPSPWGGASESEAAAKKKQQEEAQAARQQAYDDRTAKRQAEADRNARRNKWHADNPKPVKPLAAGQADWAANQRAQLKYEQDLAAWNQAQEAIKKTPGW